MVTEYGPRGPWETSDTSWGSDIEAPGVEKSDYYRGWTDVIEPGSRGNGLGGFAFVWRDGKHATDTWFPLFRSDGAPTSSIDALEKAWTGTAPADLGPEVQGITSDAAGVSLDPGAGIEATLDASDPEGGALSATWMLAVASYAVDNDEPQYCELIEDNALSVELDAPRQPGPWRLVGWAEGASGTVALASMPLEVTGDSEILTLPFAVDSYYSAAGWMGDSDELTRTDCTEATLCAPICHAWSWNPIGTGEWVGVYWQSPSGNWGDEQAPTVPPGATSITFEAWSDHENIEASFFAGMGTDSFSVREDDQLLSTEAQMFTLDLGSAEYTEVLGAFCFSVSAPDDGGAVNLYLRDIRWN